MLRTGPIPAVGLALSAVTLGCGSAPTSPAQPKAYVLSGVVTTLTGTGFVPIEGAAVQIGSGPSAITDASGSYSIREAPAGSRPVTVTKEGYATATKFVAVGADTRADFVLERSWSLAGGATLSGTVYEQTATGRVPIEGVRVEEAYRHLVTATDRDGRYDFHMDYVTLVEFDSFVRLDLTRDGFRPQSSDAVVLGDTHLDVEMLRR